MMTELLHFDLALWHLLVGFSVGILAIWKLIDRISKPLRELEERVRDLNQAYSIRVVEVDAKLDSLERDRDKHAMDVEKIFSMLGELTEKVNQILGELKARGNE